MARVLLVSANFGGIDPPIPLPPSSLSSVYYTDGAAPAEWRRVVHVLGRGDPRFQAKRYKCQVHRLEETAGAGWYLWTDACMEFRSLAFVARLADRVVRSGRDGAFVPHPDRRTPAEEYEYILRILRDGVQGRPAEYLRRRYDTGALERERDHYASRHDLTKFPLWAGGVWLLRNTPQVHAFLDAWWASVLRFSIVDQPSIPMLLEENGVRVVPFDVPLYSNEHWRRVPHE